MSVSLIIPAYNEEKRLEPFLSSVVTYYEGHPADFQEILVIDDGSNDQTGAVAERYQERLPLRLLRHHKNQGKGAAIRTGVLAARGDYIIFMDADGATDIAELPKMIGALATHQIAMGNRWMPGAHTKRHSLVRKIAGWANRTYLRFLGLGQIDTMCGFKGYRRPIALALFRDLEQPGWLFDAEIAYRAVRRGYTIINFPIEWESKDGSKLTTKTLLRSAIEIWPLIRHLRKQEST